MHVVGTGPNQRTWRNKGALPLSLAPEKPSLKFPKASYMEDLQFPQMLEQ